MDDFQHSININDGVEQVRQNGSRTGLYVPQNYKPKQNPKLRNFRIGEIIHGRILSIKSKGIGLVRLPNGDFTCQLHPGLLQNDELFFLIAGVEPSLILKVYSVQSTINRQKRKKEDIVRILDLPESDIYLFTSELYITFKTMIYKDDLLNFYKFYSKVPDSANYDEESCSRALFWMSESGLPFELDIFSIAYNYFYGLKKIDLYISYLFNNYDRVLPVSLTSLIEPFYNTLNDKSNENSSNFDYLSLNSNSEKFCFYKLISKISKTPYSGQLNNTPKYITEFIENLHLWNEICADSEAAYHWTLPHNFNGTTIFITLVFKSQFKITPYDKIHGKQNNEIDIGITINSIMQIYQSDYIAEIKKENKINNLVLILNKYFSQIGLTLLAIIYNNKSQLLTVESQNSTAISGNKSISFVI